jgi:aspartyl-tRNA(Asn)/glutamyl-tRNA(Gln) amidotransferase subunit A
MSIREVGELLRRKEISPVEVLRASLDRIQQLGLALNAFITVMEAPASQAARKAEKEILSGDWKGHLHGVPIGIKDFYDTAGVRTTAAFEHFRNRIPKKNAASVDKLIAAGGVIIGKTNMHTLGMGVTGLESFFGATKNPWNAEYVPGGSSSGSAAAVASGLCYATLDTDAIGSCRLPAACCGVVGLKGSYDLIDMSGVLDGEQPPEETIRSMAHAAVTTRGVEDAAIMAETLAASTGVAIAPRFSEILGHGEIVIIGIARNARADAEVAGAFEQAIDQVRRLGYPTRDVEAPLIDLGRGVANIVADRRGIVGQAFRDIDVLMLPTMPGATPKIEDAEQNPLAVSAELTMFANYYGLPATSVPCGFDRNGLPLNVQVVGKPNDDAGVLRLAHLLEQSSIGPRRPIPPMHKPRGQPAMVRAHNERESGNWRQSWSPNVVGYSRLAGVKQ